MRLITSLDRYRAYLLIIDRKSRYIWINLHKTKHPPVQFLKLFFDTHGRKAGRRVVRTDKGGDLWGSFEFRKTVTDCYMEQMWVLNSGHLHYSMLPEFIICYRTLPQAKPHPTALLASGHLTLTCAYGDAGYMPRRQATAHIN